MPARDPAAATADNSAQTAPGTTPAGPEVAASSMKIDQTGTAVPAPAEEILAAPKKKLGVVFWLCVGWVVAIAILAVMAGVLPIGDPNAVGVDLPGAHPSLSHLLGTDDLGRDEFARVIFGARVSLIVGFASIAFGLLIGGTLGLIAGYFRGKIDAVISALVNIMLAFPALIFALALVTFMGQSLRNVTLAIGILSIAPIARIVRGSTIVYAQREFVVAAHLLGAKRWRIIRREVLANVIPAGVSFALVAVAVAIVAEGALSFLGLSVRPPQASWGNMIAGGRTQLERYPLLSLWPSLFLFLTVLALNFVGDRLQSFFDVKEGRL